MASKRQDKDTGFIYILSDPITGEIRYIGKTTQFLDERFYQHLYDAKRHNKSHLHKWINYLLNRNLEPNIEILETVTTKELNTLEKLYISIGRQRGLNLVNISGGGEGGGSMTGKHHSEESKKKMSDAKKGRPMPKGCTERSLELRTGKPLAEETKRKISKSHTGLSHTEETRKKLSTINTGKIASEETRKKISLAVKGRPSFWRGKHLSEKTKEKMREAHKNRKQEVKKNPQ